MAVGRYELLADLGQGSQGRVVRVHDRERDLVVALKAVPPAARPTLVRELVKRGLECTGVQVKVQARQAIAASKLPTLKPLSARTSRELTALSDTLPASPLRRALEHLLERSARQE